MNLPNRLTVLRVCLIPFFVFFLLADITKYHYFIALGIFAIASLTDWFDGRIARKRNLITNFGKFMDPLADKLLVCSGLISLVYIMAGQASSDFSPRKQVVFTVAVIVIISRELFISGFRILAADQNIVLAAGWWGKVKTATQMVMTIVVLVLLQLRLLDLKGTIINVLDVIQWVLIIASLALTVISMVDYVIKNKGVLKN